MGKSEKFLHIDLNSQKCSTLSEFQKSVSLFNESYAKSQHMSEFEQMMAKQLADEVDRLSKEDCKRLSVASLNPPKPENGRFISNEETLQKAVSSLRKKIGGSSDRLILQNLDWALHASTQKIAQRAIQVAKEGSEMDKAFVEVYDATLFAKLKANRGDTDDLIALAQTVQRLKDESQQSAPLPRIVGGNYPQRPGSLHSPTISEILYQANKPRPTEPYFRDSDQGGRWIDPMEPYTDFSHDIPQTVDPRKPPYHNPTQGG